MKSLSILLLALVACDERPPTEADAAPSLDCVTLHACGEEADGGEAPSFTVPANVVPSAEMPPEVVSQVAHNNLDITEHDGRLFFAFRTAPSHFASPEVHLYVVSTTDHRVWRFEGDFHVGRDIREPRLLSLNGRLRLYMALLGTDRLDFEPGGTVRVDYEGPGRWSDPTPAFPDDFIPWRIRVVDGRAYVLGYTGGAEIYDTDAEPLEVHWLQSEDGETWAPVVRGQPVVLRGGGSETDLAFLEDGGVVAVTRNEAGDEGGFGSRICHAEASALGTWRCANDPRKYDSPLVFRHGDQVWLVGRRTLGEDGRYDLGREDLPPAQQWALYQSTYWNSPKRCALWRVDPGTLAVTHALDLPSAGDTCFASVVPLGRGQYLLYNYSSPFEDPDRTWIQGQNAPTFIYRTTLTLP